MLKLFTCRKLITKLACLQLLLSNQEKKEAIEVKEFLNDEEKSLPGIFCALVTLYISNNSWNKASHLLPYTFSTAETKLHTCCLTYSQQQQRQRFALVTLHISNSSRDKSLEILKNAFNSYTLHKVNSY